MARTHYLICNLDGTFRGYEWAIDDDGNIRSSIVLAQEGRWKERDEQYAALVSEAESSNIGTAA